MGSVLATDGLITSLEEGIERVQGKKRSTLVSATARIEPLDAVAGVCAARLASDHWFCWEQPDRDFALGALGVADQLVSRGDARFDDLAEGAASLARDRIDEGSEGAPAGVGPLWCGGFSFAPDGGESGPWSSFPPAALTLPELSLCSVGGETWLTLNLVAGPGRAGAERLDALRARLAGLRDAEMPMLDPIRTGKVAVRSASPPGEFERAVAAATDRIDAGALTKVVLAREVVVSAPSAHDPAAIFGALRQLFPSCFSFCCGTPEAAFLGASPELLVRRSGASASTVALAGSTRRSSDPAVDDHLGEQLLRSDKDRREQEIVTKRIVRTLRPHAVWVENAPEPTVIKVANIQHLATPIVAQLADPHSAVELAGLLHPTPAVGGEPWDLAGPTIEELERMDRGWYAGPVGWMDATEDGEFCVALRSAVLRDRDAHLFAGVGVVAGSDPAAELAETEIKLRALLPLLSE